MSKERLTAVAAEYLLINDGSDRQTVKAVGESLPQFYIVPTFTYNTTPIGRQLKHGESLPQFYIVPTFT